MRRREAALLRALALPMSVLAACAGDGPTGGGAPARVAAPIIGGTPAAGDDAVVALLTSPGHAFCTGTLISSRLVLTAGHCTAGPPPGYVFIGPSIGQTGTMLPVVAAYPHPAYTDEDFRHADIGVVVLGVRAAVEPRIPSSAPMTVAMTGRLVRLVGYGFQQSGPSGAFGDRMQVETPITMVGAKELEYGLATCNGDSGGPAFLEQDDGTEVIVGITSWGDGDCSSIGGSSRVDVYGDWLAQVIAAEDPVSCQRDFRCAGDCDQVDPDCPCSADDGMCSAGCPDPDSDPDCPAGCGANGACVADGCAAPDPDCGSACGAEGHCMSDCPSRDPDCPPPAAAWQACTSNFDCDDTARCLAAEGGGTVCTPLCTPGADQCAAGAECRGILPGVAVCTRTGGDGGRGCAVGGGGSGRPVGALLLVLAGLAGLALVRGGARRSRHVMRDVPGRRAGPPPHCPRSRAMRNGPTGEPP